MMNSIDITAPKWTGGIKEIVYTGSVVKAVFFLTLPFAGQALIIIKPHMPSDVIRIEKDQTLARKMCAHVGAKISPVGFKIPAEMMPVFLEAVQRAVTLYDAEQDAIKVNYWEWTTNDSHRVHLTPVPRKHTKATAALINRVAVSVSEAEMIDISERIGEDAGERVSLDGDVFHLPPKVKYQVSNAALMALIASKDQAKADRVNAAIEKAKETGEPVIIRKWTDECDDPREDCSMDIVCEMAYPDGQVRITRSHTW